MKTMPPHQKSSKTLSKLNKISINQPSVNKQLHSPDNKSRIDFIEQALQHEIQAREAANLKLLELIHHLQNTKKSKVPIKYEKITSKKFNSPNKTHQRHTKQNQTCYTNQKQVQNQNNLMFSRFEESICHINRKFQFVSEELDRIDRNVSTLQQSYHELEQNITTQNQKNNKIIQSTLTNLQKNILETLSDRLLQNNQEIQQKLSQILNNNIQLLIQQQHQQKDQKLKQFEILNKLIKELQQSVNIMGKRMQEEGIEMGNVQKSLRVEIQGNRRNVEINRREIQRNIQGLEQLSIQSSKKINQILKENQKLGYQVDQNNLELRSLVVQATSSHETTISQLQPKIFQKLHEQLIQHLQPLSQIQTTYNHIQTIEQSINNKLSGLQNLQIHTNKIFQHLNKEITSTTKILFDTKESLQNIFYGETRQKQQIQSNVSIEINNEGCNNFYWKDTMEGLVKRMGSIQNSFQMIYQEYLNKPFI